MASLIDFALSSQHMLLHKNTYTLQLYERYLSRFIDESINVIYIGNDLGSAQMLDKVLKKAKVYVLSNDHSIEKHSKDSIKILSSDTFDDIFLVYAMKLIGDYSIVVDSLEQSDDIRIKLFDKLYEFLDKNGVYIVEHVSKSSKLIDRMKQLVDKISYSSKEDMDKHTYQTNHISFYGPTIVIEKESVNGREHRDIITGNNNFSGSIPNVVLQNKDKMIMDLRSQIDKLQNELSIKSDLLSNKLHDATSSSILELKSKHMSLLHELKEKDRRLKSMTDRLTYLEKNNKGFDKEQLNLKIAELEREKLVLQRKLEDEKTQLRESLEKERNDLKSKLDEHKNILSRIDKERQDLRNRLERENVELRRRLDEQTKALNMSVTEKNNIHSTLQKEKDELKAKLDENQRILTKLEKEKDELKSKLDENEQILNKLNEQVSTDTDVMSSSGDDKKEKKWKKLFKLVKKKKDKSKSDSEKKIVKLESLVNMKNSDSEKKEEENKEEKKEDEDTTSELDLEAKDARKKLAAVLMKQK